MYDGFFVPRNALLTCRIKLILVPSISKYDMYAFKQSYIFLRLLYIEYEDYCFTFNSRYEIYYVMASYRKTLWYLII